MKWNQINFVKHFLSFQFLGEVVRLSSSKINETNKQPPPQKKSLVYSTREPPKYHRVGVRSGYLGVVQSLVFWTGQDGHKYEKD